MLTPNISEVTQARPETPPSNTGVKLPEEQLKAGIDWLAVTFPRVRFSEVSQLVESLFSEPLVRQSHGWKFYTESYRSPQGVLLADRRMEGDSLCPEAYLSIPASCLGLLQLEGQGLLFATLYELGARSSRLDARIDDYGKTITIEKVEEAVRSGNVAHFKNFRFIESGSIAGSGTGRTIEFGARGKRGSGKFLRIYDKSVESRGHIDCIRVELELSGARSRDCFAILAQTPPELWPELIGGWIKSAIAFVDRSVSDKLYRCPLLSWWAELVDRFSELSLSVDRPTKSIEKVKKWLQKQVAPSLALILNYLRGESEFDIWFYELLSQGESRLNAMHRSMLSQNEVFIESKVSLNEV